MRNARLAVLGLALVIGVACAAPGLAQDADPEKAAAEAVAARERAAKAVEEARVAEEKAQRAKRRALEKELAAKEDALDAARAAGDAAAVTAAENAIRGISAQLAVMHGTRSAAGARAVAAPVRVPMAPYRPDEGLPPDAVRPVSPNGIAAALDWLARHQSPGGHWDSDGFDAHCKDGKCPGAGGPLFDTGATGLATLAFLGTGETHKTPKHGAVVREALRHLKGIQDAEGCFGPRTSNHFTYNHAMAALAMAEAYGLTQSPLIKDSAQKGMDFVAQCRNPYLAWRYGVRPQDNDTSVTGWMVLALRSGKNAGLAVDEQAFLGARAWLDKVTEPEYGRAGYTARGNGPSRYVEVIDAFPVHRSESLTAEAVATRFFCGQDGSEPLVRKGLELIGRSLPRWDRSEGTIDFVYWYWGTLATKQAGGDARTKWFEALGEALRPHQRGAESGCARGSWDPVDAWGRDGGRVYATAINAMAARATEGYLPIGNGK